MNVHRSLYHQCDFLQLCTHMLVGALSVGLLFAIPVYADDVETLVIEADAQGPISEKAQEVEVDHATPIRRMGEALLVPAGDPQRPRPGW